MDTNDNTEQLIHRAWHDLGAPLRAIRLLVEMIETDAEPLGPNTRQNLTLIAGRADRAESLLNQLLEYLMLDISPPPVERLDTREVVDEAVDQLRQHGNFSITVSGTWPTVSLPRKAFVAAVEELLTNAVKHHGGARGTIQISASASATELTVAVTDDGKGIDERFAKSVFEFGKTLQSQDQIEGNGMGLTLIARSLRCYGGHIRLQSQPGEGSTFTMVWMLNSDQTLNR